MTSPSGLGWWVAFERSIDAGPKAADLAKALAVCEATGATWVCLRAGDGGHPDADLTEASILAFKQAGIRVYLWPFVYGHALSGTIAICKHWRGLCLPGGDPAVDGVILNAEFDFLATATPAMARSLVGDIRALGYSFVGHAPPDFAGGRGDGPLATLDEVCDAIYPQCYAYEHNDGGHVHTLDAVLSLYRKRGYYLEKVNPILCSYRPLTRGYTTAPPGSTPEEKAAFKGKPIPTIPLVSEPALVANDVIAGLDHLDVLGGCAAPSIYTIDAMTGGWASRKGVGDAVLAALTARANRHPVVQYEPTIDDSHLPAHPLGLADRAEQIERERQDALTDPGTPRAKLASSDRLRAVRDPDVTADHDTADTDPAPPDTTPEGA